MKNIILFALLTLIALILSGCTQSPICGDGICSSEETDPNSNYFCTNDCGKEINQKVLENGKCYEDSDCDSSSFCCSGNCYKKESNGEKRMCCNNRLIITHFGEQEYTACCANKIIYNPETAINVNEKIVRTCCEKVPIVLEQKYFFEMGVSGLYDGSWIRESPIKCCGDSDCPMEGHTVCDSSNNLIYQTCDNHQCVTHNDPQPPGSFACDCSSGTCKVV